MSNSLIQEYRSTNPYDSRSDAELTLLLGKDHDQDGRFSTYPDFLQEYDQIKRGGSQSSAQLEQAFAPGPVEYAKQAVGSFGRALSGGYASIPEGIGIGVAEVERRLGDPLVSMQQDRELGDPEANLFTKAGKAIRRFGEAVTPEPVPALQNSFWATTLPGAFGSGISFLTGGLVGRAAKIPKTVIGGMGAASGAVQGYEDAEAHGADPDQKLKSWLLGAGVGLSELVPFAGIINRLDQVSGKTFKQRLIRAGADSLEEAIQEAFQSGSSDAIAKYIAAYDPDRVLLKDAAENAAAGGIVGFTLSLLASSVGAKLQAGSNLVDPSLEPKTGKITESKEYSLVKLAHAEMAGESNGDVPIEVKQAVAALDPKDRSAYSVIKSRIDYSTLQEVKAVIGALSQAREAEAEAQRQAAATAMQEQVYPQMPRTTISAEEEGVSPGNLPQISSGIGDEVAIGEAERLRAMREAAAVDTNALPPDQQTYLPPIQQAPPVPPAETTAVPVAPPAAKLPATTASTSPPDLEAFSNRLNEILDKEGVSRNSYSESDRAMLFEEIKKSGATADEIQAALESEEGRKALVAMGLAKPLVPPMDKIRRATAAKLSRLQSTPPPAEEPVNPKKPSTPGAVYIGETMGIPTYNLTRPILDPATGEEIHPKGSTVGEETLDTYGVKYEKPEKMDAAPSTDSEKVSTELQESKPEPTVSEKLANDNKQARTVLRRLEKVAASRGWDTTYKDVSKRPRVTRKDVDKAVKGTDLSIYSFGTGLLDVELQDMGDGTYVIHRRGDLAITKEEAKPDEEKRIEEKGVLSPAPPVPSPESVPSSEPTPPAAAETTAQTETPTASPTEVVEEAQQGKDNSLPTTTNTTPPKLRLPANASPRMAPNEEVRRKFQDVARALESHGYGVRVVRTLSREFGRYDNADRLVTLALHDVNNPSVENLITLLHESAHALFGQQSTDLKEAITAAIDAMSNEQLGIEKSSDPRIRNLDIAEIHQQLLESGMSPEQAAERAPSIMAEERLAEHLAQRGIDKTPARGLAQRIFQLLKELYLKAAIEFQRLFGQRQNPELVRRYIELRFDRFLTGRGDAGLFSFLGAPPHPAREADHYVWAGVGQVNEYYDQSSGRVRYPMVIPDSEAAAVYGLENPPMFRKPDDTSDTNALRRVNAEIRIAAFNDLRALEQRVATLLAPMLPKGADGVSFFRTAAGLKNTDTLINAIASRVEGANTGVTMDELGDNRFESALQAYQYRLHQWEMMGNRIAKLKAEVQERRAKKDEAAEELVKSRTNYLDIEGLASETEKALRIFMRRVQRDMNRESVRMGVVSQQLAALDDQKRDGFLPKAYEPVFRRLNAAGKLTGARLFDFLDAMANDATIDFNQGIRAIRQAMEASRNPAFNALTERTQESRALLAAVVAYAKTNARMMALIELRRMRSGEERLAISRRLEELFKRGAELRTDTRVLRRAAVLEDRARAEFTKDLQRVRKVERALQAREKQVEALELAQPMFRDEVSRLQGETKTRQVNSFGDGMIYYVPTIDASGDAVYANPKKIALDSTREITNQAELAADLKQMTQFLGARESSGQLDGEYWTIKAARDEILHRGVFEKSIVETNLKNFFLQMSDEGTKAESLGFPSGRLLNQMLKRFGALTKNLSLRAMQLSTAAERARSQAMNALGGTSLGFYAKNFYNEAADFMEKQKDLGEITDNPERQKDIAYDRLLKYFLSDTEVRAKKLAGRELEFMRALRKHLEAEEAANQFFEQHNIPTVFGDVSVINPATGTLEEGARARMKRGLLTLPETISGEFRQMFVEMNRVGWQATLSSGSIPGILKNAAQIYNKEGSAALSKIVQPLFTQENIKETFFRDLANVSLESAFRAPSVDEQGTQPDADPDLTKQAYEESGGNVVRFAERMHELHGGTQDIGDYVDDILRTFVGYYAEVRETMGKVDPAEGRPDVTEFENMVPGFQINARKFHIRPASWTTHVMFDSQNTIKAIHAVAAQQAFGPRSERLASVYATMESELEAGLAKLTSAEEAAEAAVASRSRKVLQNEIARRVGGHEQLAHLRGLRDKKNLVPGIKTGLVSFFQNHSPVKDMRLTVQIVRFLSQRLLQQHLSSIMQVPDAIAFVMDGGFSARNVGSMARMFGDLGVDLAAGLGQAIGIQISAGDRFAQRWSEGYGDPLITGKFMDATLEEASGPDESWKERWMRGLRKADRAMGFGVNLAGEKATHTVFRPFAPFTQMQISIMRTLTINVWRRYDSMVSDGVRFMLNNPEALRDPKFGHSTEEWVSALKLRGAEATAFKRLTESLKNSYGLDYGTTVREAVQNKAEGKDLLSNTTTGILHGWVTQEVQLDGNIATMSSSVPNSLTLSLLSPLLGWAFRRMLKVQRLDLDAQGRRDGKLMINGLMALGAMAAGGLAFGVMADEYHERILGKKRNLRDPFEANNVPDFLRASLEQLNRVGLAGLWGEFINGAVNVGTGESDNRDFSLDSRVVAVNTVLSVKRAISNLINQDFEADYPNVIRPLIMSFGANAPLQYLQAGNHLFGLDNPEARIVARINAGNWLRGTGRNLDMEVRLSKGGFSTPTPLTPHVLRMVLAAYANDPVRFQAAYTEAVQVARESGQADPVDYVKRSFRSRHPLLSTFRVAPSPAEYQRILAAMPDNGREVVSDAVRLHNHYAEKIGASAFTGKTEKPKKTWSLDDFRLKSLSVPDWLN